MAGQVGRRYRLTRPVAALVGAELGVAFEVGAALALGWADASAPGRAEFAWPGLSM